MGFFEKFGMGSAPKKKIEEMEQGKIESTDMENVQEGVKEQVTNPSEKEMKMNLAIAKLEEIKQARREYVANGGDAEKAKRILDIYNTQVKAVNMGVVPNIGLTLKNIHAEVGNDKYFRDIKADELINEKMETHTSISSKS